MVKVQVRRSGNVWRVKFSGDIEGQAELAGTEEGLVQFLSTLVQGIHPLCGGAYQRCIRSLLLNNPNGFELDVELALPDVAYRYRIGEDVFSVPKAIPKDHIGRIDVLYPLALTMPEVEYALDAETCPLCGADLEWNHGSVEVDVEDGSKVERYRLWGRRLYCLNSPERCRWKKEDVLFEVADVEKITNR